MGESESTGVCKKGVFPENIRQILAESQGYTMIELIMVVVLIAIVSVSVLPKFFDTSSITVEGATAMVVADIRYTQELAMSTNSSKTIDFPNVTDGATYYTVDSRTVNLPSKVIIPDGYGATFTFNSLGEPTAGGGSSVEIKAGSSPKIITVDSNTGRVSSS